MNHSQINILAISGSLRSNSAATAILHIAGGLMPTGVHFNIYTGLEEIPAFNDSASMPLPVANFIRLITEADAVFFCIPEYAFGVPGALKNALDWTVSSTAFSDKPVALITAASQGEKAHAAMLLTLSAIGAKIEKEATLLISFIRNKLDEQNELKDKPTLDAIQHLVETFIRSIDYNTGNE